MMLSRNKKVRDLNSLNPLKSRRTSLNVNLSYTSNLSSLTEDDYDDRTNLSSISEQNHLTRSPENTVIEKSDPPVRWNLSTKKRSIVSKQPTSTTNTINQSFTNLIKPSFVKIMRITSTPVKSKNENLIHGQATQEKFLPSERTTLSNALEDVRFPLEGEIFSPNASLLMETSMDITEVQGGAILNFDPVESSFVDDTEILEDVEHRMEAVIIPDSEQDSFNTVRTSLNVNTSLDSRFSLMPNNSLYDPKKISNNEIDSVLSFHPVSQSSEENIPPNSIVTTALVERENTSNDVNECRISLNVNTSLDSRFSFMPNNSIYDPKKRSDGVLSHPVSQSADENLPMNSIITTALISREDLLNNVNNPRSVGQEPNLDLDLRREHRPLNCSENNESSGEDYTVNRKESNRDPDTSILNLLSEGSSTEASSQTNQDYRDQNPRIVSNEVSEAKPIKKGKRRLMRLRGSEMVDLSPVTVKIGRENRIVTKKRIKKRNKTAKKIVNEKIETAKTLVPVGCTSSEDEMEEINLLPKKAKKVRKLKSKKIVIKKMADVHLWNKMNQNTDNLNESFDDMSSALGRTSLDNFAPKHNFAKQKHRTKKPRIIIVVTGLPMEQKSLVKSTVTAFGSAKLEKIVTRNTTHVVSKGVRTVNLLRGMVRGCWIVNFEWILKSREAGDWIRPDNFEITSFSKAVQENRKEKQLFGAAYVSELFLACGLIHINEETSTPAQVLKELVRIAGGRVTAQPEEAKIIVGRGGLKEVWILDSITSGEIQPLDQYCKKKKISN